MDKIFDFQNWNCFLLSMSRLRFLSIILLIWSIFGWNIKVWTNTSFPKFVKITPKQGINFGASWIRLKMHIAVSTHLVNSFFFKSFLKIARKQWNIVISFVSADLNEIKLERNNRKADVSSGMIHGNSSKQIPYFWPIFADCQKQVFNSNLNILAKYEPNWTFNESKYQVAHSRLKIIQIWKINHLVSILGLHLTRAFFTHPVEYLNFIQVKSGRCCSFGV